MMSEQKVSRDHCDKKREREQDKRVCRVEEETERVKNHLRMFVLFWVTLLFSVRGSSADTDSSTGLKQHCGSAYGYCVSLSEGTITAEAGLCVVIPCSFTTGYGFRPSAIVWYKCDPSKEKCDDSDIIFHSRKNNEKAQSGFIGRVSSLEPDVKQRNCSIMINDLNESDSGLYQLRVNGYKYEGTAYERTDGFTYPSRSTVSVKGVSQKLTVMIPPLIEGQQSTLTCTAPGLCSGSVPTITWMWRGAAEDDSLLRGNITGYQTENVTAVTQRHSSTLTFNSSAEHHGSSISCKVSFTGGATTEETVTLNVTCLLKILSSSRCEVQSEVLTCVCITEGFPLPTIKWPLLESHTKYSVMTTVSDHTVNSSIILSVKDHGYTEVECVASSDVGEVKRNLIIIKTDQEVGLLRHHGCYSGVLPWAVAGSSISVNVLFIICILGLWNARKKVNPNERDRTYMSLQKPDPSSEYEVIALRQN